MSTYRAKTGSNIALGSLTTLSPQPRSEGIKATRRNVSASGGISDEGRYVELLWDLLPDTSAYTTILTVFGLHNALYAAVTVYVRDERWAWVRMNGIAVLPEIGADAGWDRYYPRNLKLLVKNLSAAS